MNIIKNITLLILCLNCVFTVQAQSCVENTLSTDELSNIDANVESYTFSKKDYYTLADVTFSMSGSGPALSPYSTGGIWIGANNGTIDYSDITITFSKPITSLSFLLSHFNNDGAINNTGEEELQNFKIYNTKGKNLTESSTFTWLTGPECGIKESLPDATKFNNATKTISANIGTGNIYGSGRITITNKIPFTKLTFRHQELGNLPQPNGVIITGDFIFCVYTPENPVKKAIAAPVATIDTQTVVPRFNDIFFDFDKSDIKTEASLELDKYIELFKRYPDMKLEISSYSDCRGNSSYNSILSNKRAEATAKYLITKGIPANQVSSTGHGESNVHTCDCNEKESNCQEKEYQNHRKTEIFISSLGNLQK